MRRRLFVALAGLCIAGGAVPLLPARPAEAYMLECCAFTRQAAPRLVMAVWAQHSIDNSPWFTTAVAEGVNDWNNTPTPIFISLEYTTSTTEQIAYWTDMASAQTPGPSTGGCMNWDSNNYCTLGYADLVEGCYSICNMSSGTPNYDQAAVGHELGHALGLAHSCTSGALMSGPNSACGNGGAPYSCNGEKNCINTPQNDDLNGVIDLYGRNGVVAGGGPGCAPTAPLPVASPLPVPAITPVATPPGIPLLGPVGNVVAPSSQPDTTPNVSLPGGIGLC